MKKVFMIVTMVFALCVSAFADKIKCVKETYTYQNDDGKTYTNVFYVIENFVIFDFKWPLAKTDKLLFYTTDGKFYYNNDGYPTYLGNGRLSDIVYGVGDPPRIINEKKEETWYDKTEFYHLLIEDFYEHRLKMSGSHSREELWALEDFILTGEKIYTKEELRILRNTIYAKYGYIFKSRDLTYIFSKSEWYKPQFDNGDFIKEKMNKTEECYLELIRNLEE